MLKQLVVCAALVGATSSVAVAGNGTNLTKYVADTTQVMFVLDVSAAKSSQLVKESFNKLIDSQPDARAKLDEIGLDPLRDIDTVMIAFGGFDEISNMKDSSMVMVIEGRLPKDAIAKIRAKAGSTEKINGAEVFSRDDTEISLMDNRIFVTKKGHMGEVISFAKGKSKANLASGAGGKALRDTIKRASTKMHMWGAIALPAKDKEKTVAAQLPVDGVSFAFKFSSDLEGFIRLETPSPTSAEASIKTLNAALPQVKMMMGGIGLDVAGGTIVLAQDKASINASVKVTQTELKSLFALIAQKKASASTPPPTKPTGPPPPPPTGGLSGGKSKTP